MSQICILWGGKHGTVYSQSCLFIMSYTNSKREKGTTQWTHSMTQQCEVIVQARRPRQVLLLEETRQAFKGTGSPDQLGYCGPVWIDQGLNKGRGSFLNFLGTPLIFPDMKVILPVKPNTSWFYNVSGVEALYRCSQ